MAAASTYFTCYKCGSQHGIPMEQFRADSPMRHPTAQVDRFWCPTCDTVYRWSVRTRSWEEDAFWKERRTRTSSPLDVLEVTDIVERVMERHGVISTLKDI